MLKTRLVNIHKEPYDVSIMRPGYFGNQYIIGKHGTREEVVQKHWTNLLSRLRYDDLFLKELLKLRGKTLGCCCTPEICHGDNLLKILNAKVIGIIGSRRRNSNEDFSAIHTRFLEIYNPGDIIVSGGCPKGGDRFAETIADLYNIPIMIFRANWNRFGRGAGFVRNTDIARESCELIACVTADRTGGTEDTVKKFLKDKDESLLHLV